MSVYRIYVEKKPEFAVEAQSVLSDLQTALRTSVTGVRVINRYDADNLTAESFEKAIPTVFSEPAVDNVYKKLPKISGSQRMFATEYLPGQFDQRADSAVQCVKFLNEDENKILNQKVKKSGLNKSEFFRKIILDYQLKEKPDEKFYEILSQLRGMATNLNQMARTYNKYQGYMREDKINPLLNQIQNFILALQEVYLIPQKEKNISGW